MQIFIRNWDKGVITRIEKETVPRGGASDALNWHFLGDRIELRRGQVRMGEEVTGTGKVTFVKSGRKYDGTQVLFHGYGRKFLYHDGDADSNIEIGSDMLPAAADGEDIAATLYQSLAGSFLYASSPNSSVYKIPIANPGSAVDQLQDTYRGYIKALQGRLALWNRKDKYGGSDKTGLNLSAIDRDSLADYTLTSAEDVGTGDGATAAFTGTLAFKAAAPKKTCHFVRFAAPIAALTSITAITQATSAQVTSASHGLAVGDVVVFQDIAGMTQLNKRIAVVLTVPTANTFTIDIDTSGFSVYSSGGSVGKAELFTDLRSGTLSGSQGGTGTINYATGAFTLTFSANVVNTGEVVADYYTEDSTDQGILDFSQGDGSSIADSLTFRQDDAGEFMNIGAVGSTYFCPHQIKTYALRLISSTDITNLIYREKLGIPYWRAFCPTGDGIYYLDATDPKDPAVRILETTIYTSEVRPRSISDNLDLSGFRFDASVIFEWGEYIVMACRTSDSTINNRFLMYHRIWETWEIHSLRVSDMDTLDGALVGGDSGSNNIYKLFTGLADEEAAIENYIILGNDDCDKDGVKDLRRMKVAGMIGDDQELEVAYSIDNAPFVVATTIEGSGPYVDSSQRRAVGALTLGEEMIGGGAAETDAIFASPYEYEFFVGTPRYQRIRIRYRALAVGYASVSEQGFVDLRDKGKRLPVKYVG